MRLRAIFSALLLCAPVVARCQMGDADVPSDTFLVQAYLVKSPDVIDQLKNSDKKLETLAESKRGDDLFLAVAFTCPEKDKQGNAKVTFTFTMTMPNKQEISKKDIKAGDGPITDALRKTWMFASTKPIKVTLTDAYPAGTYKFKVVGTDAVGGKDFTSEVSINIK